MTFKITTASNSDGLIKCLPPARTVSQSVPKSMREKFKSSINFGTTGQFHLPGQHHCLAGRRAGALFFALHRDYFIVTRNFAAVYLDLLPFRSFTMTRSSLPSNGTGKKTRHRDHAEAWQAPTAPNQTAGPLALIDSSDEREID